MRHILFVVACLAHALVAAGAAAAPVGFTGTLEIQFPSAGGALLSTTGAGTANVTGAAPPGFTVPAGAFQFVGSAATLGATSRTILLNASNAAGSFPAGGAPFVGLMPLSGTLTHGWFTIAQTTTTVTTPTTTTITIPFGTNVQVQLDPAVIGFGGTAMGTTTAGLTTFTATLAGGNYTTGTIMVGTLTLAGADGRNAAGIGNLQLVTPITLTSGAFPGGVQGFGRLTLTFVPEPSTALLLGLGVVGLALKGQRRRRS